LGVGHYEILRIELRSIVQLSPFQETCVNKLYPSAAAALKGIVADGQLMAVGGFGLCGIPEALIDALRDSGVKNLTVISNNAGVDGFGLGKLLETRQIKKMISATSARTRSSSASTWPASWSWNSRPRARWPRSCAPAAPAFRPSSPAPASAPGGRRQGAARVRRQDLRDGALAGARGVAGQGAPGRQVGQPAVFRLTARNFNPAVAMAGKICVVEVEEIVETGAMVPDQVHLPGIYVHRIVHNPNPEKRIESAP
jgi:3-oxoacid CoA-transferase subunit A